MDIRGLLTYTDNCRQTLRDTLAAHPASLHAPISTLGEYKSIARLIAHMIRAEQVWTLHRLLSLPRPAPYEDHAPDTLIALFSDWDDIRARTRAFVKDTHSAAHPSGLHRPIACAFGGGYPSVVLTAEEILFHIFNHQSFHTAQISMALQQQGIDPPVFDYLFLK